MAKKRSNVREHILSSIINYIEKNNGRSPTYREIGDDEKIQSLGHIAYHLKSLEENGYIQRAHNKSRSITVLKNLLGSSLTGPVAVAAGTRRAIMSGSVQDGQLIPK